MVTATAARLATLMGKVSLESLPNSWLAPMKTLVATQEKAVSEKPLSTKLWR
jgi:hypothetical protein